jgi:hypothetical protein
MSEGGDQKAPDDPLGSAYQALKGDDPLIQSAKQHIWRRLWVRDNVEAWITCADMPALSKYLHRALPQGDVELLEEIKMVAGKFSNSPYAFFIIGLVNERLERCHSRNADPASQQSAVTRSPFTSLEVFKTGRTPAKNRENYNGQLCAGVKRFGGDWLAGTPDLPGETTSLPPKTHCQLEVWMQPERPEGAWSDKLLIETGLEEDIVNFSFEVDCATLHFPYGRKSLRFHRRVKSDSVIFDFFTPKNKSEHLLYVHVFQDPALVKSLLVILKVAVSGHGIAPH